MKQNGFMLQVSFLAHLIVAADDLLQRCKAVQKVLLWDPKLNVLMDVGPAREENYEEATSAVCLCLSCVLESSFL